MPREHAEQALTNLMLELTRLWEIERTARAFSYHAFITRAPPNDPDTDKLARDLARAVWPGWEPPP